MKHMGIVRAPLLALLLILSLPTAAAPAPSPTATQSEIAALKTRLEQMEKEANQSQAAVNDLKAQLEKLQAQLSTQQNSTKSVYPQVPSKLPDLTWNFNGSTVVNFMRTTGPMHSNFGGAQLLPVFLVKYQDWLLYEGHLEIAATTAGETETALEYSQADLFISDNATLIVGKFLTPVGRFQEAFHPPWINKLPTRPAGFDEDGNALPVTDMGIQLRGAVPLGSMIGGYALFVGNGPHFDSEGLVAEGTSGDPNGNKAVGGRLSLRPVPNLEFGVSGMHAAVAGIAGQSGPVGEAGFNLIGADGQYRHGAFDVRGEWMRRRLDAFDTALDPTDPSTQLLPETTWKSWYLQMSYRLSSTTGAKWLGNVEPVIRYSHYTVDGFSDFAEDAEKRWAVGADYWFAANAVAKIAVERKDFEFKNDQTALILQFAFGW